MTSEHDDLREWAGAYVLDALDGDERRRFESHLAGCQRCQAEVAALAPLPGMLARLDPEDVRRQSEPAPEAIIGQAVDAISDEGASLRRSLLRWRIVSAVAAIAAVTVLLWPAPAGTTPVPLEIVAGSQGSGSISLEARGWGSVVDIDLAGLPVRDEYVAWAVGPDGTRHIVATWAPGGGDSMTLVGASSFPITDLKEVVVCGVGEYYDPLLTAVAPES